MIINLFLLFCELFKEFYTDSVHTDAARYLLFGLEGHHGLVPWFWTGLLLQVGALTLLLRNISKTNLFYLNVACVMCATGIWIEKGMGLIVPGFVPTPIGEMIEYSPSITEWLVSWGIWAFGLLLYTVLLKMTVPVLSGMIRANGQGIAPLETNQAV
jgi:molybdopterin-containing oxidoreductase family membrane subunit